VYLREGASESRASEVARSLAEKVGGSASVVSPDAALARLRAELRDLGDAVRELPSNPPPYSVQVRRPAKLCRPTALPTLPGEARAVPLVQDVDYSEEAVARLTAISRALRYGGLMAFTVIGLATVFVVAATLQLAIYARRDEIEIQKLVGATNRFVKAPFL